MNLMLPGQLSQSDYDVHGELRSVCFLLFTLSARWQHAVIFRKILLTYGQINQTDLKLEGFLNVRICSQEVDVASLWERNLRRRI